MAVAAEPPAIPSDRVPAHSLTRVALAVVLVALLAADLLAATLPGGGDPAHAPAPRSRAERTNYEETSLAADVDRFLAELASQSELLRVGTFGHSEEKRPLRLAILSSPPLATPREARMLGRPIVLLQANIHGGEVEGKEATQHLLRRLAIGDLRPLLDQVVVLAIPNYNADGNEAIDLLNRSEQYGPIGGVGRRENANGLDLNRDCMKLDSAEARAFVSVLNEWDPHVVVDLHTTNGSHHGYHLTYSIPLSPATAPRLLDYERETLMPALRSAMLSTHRFRTYYYGNFGESPLKPPPDEGRTWVAFDHRPRLGQNYVGLRNRIAILSEAYSYLDFRDRIAVTEAFVTEILRYVAEHDRTIVTLLGELDAETIRQAQSDEPIALGVEVRPRPLPEKVPILVGKTTTKLNPRSGKEMTVVVPDAAEPVLMTDYGLFEASRAVPVARAYAIPSDGRTAAAIERLQQHGVTVEELVEPWSGNTHEFLVESIERASRPFQGRHGVTLHGKETTRDITLPAGTIIVRLAQPLGRLVAYLLEPESDDGLIAWGLLDEALAAEQPAPIVKLMRPTGLVTRIKSPR
jgi:hypothetical protein